MEVTSHTGCVSRNAAIIGFALGGSCHIPHGMCEQKFDPETGTITATNVTSHTGCVSRNPKVKTTCYQGHVTSHTGCVSRNLAGHDSRAKK